MTHVVLTGMHKTAVCSRTVAYLLYVYSITADALLCGELFVRIYKIYLVFISHVITDVMSDTGLQILVLGA